MYLIIKLVTVYLFLICADAVNVTLREEARRFLEHYNEEDCKWAYHREVVDWAYATNMTDYNLKIKEDFYAAPKNISKIQYPWKDFDDPKMFRCAGKNDLLNTKEQQAQIDAVVNEKSLVINEMVKISNALRVCNYTNSSDCSLGAYPEIFDMFTTSNDPAEMKYYWLTYMNALTPQLRPLYEKYIALSTEEAKLSNYSNMADKWINTYEGPPVAEFEQEMINIYNQMKPLYTQLFVFIRKRFFDLYGPEVINRTGPLPIHLLGSMNGLGLDLIIDKIKPFTNKPSIDVSDEIVKRNITAKGLAHICEDFYTSLGLPPMPDSFWNNSLFEAPEDRHSNCYQTAWDFHNGKDYRVLVCGTPDMDTLLGFCHELGHLKYFMGYKNQPCCFRESANLGVNEGLADTGGLSIITTERMGRLGLIDSCTIDPEVEINRLFYAAVRKVAYQPFQLLLEIWRYRYFRGQITNENSNAAWWDLRLEFQGVVPPEPRSEKYLDSLSKSHVITDAQYIMYFLASIFQFQFHQSLCIAANEYDPNDPNSPTLDECDIYGSKKAGKLLKGMFKIGSSKTWQYAVAAITGQHKISATPILGYYKKLYDWLVTENARTGEYIGWL